MHCTSLAGEGGGGQCVLETVANEFLFMKTNCSANGCAWLC